MRGSSAPHPSRRRVQRQRQVPAQEDLGLHLHDDLTAGYRRQDPERPAGQCGEGISRSRCDQQGPPSGTSQQPEHLEGAVQGPQIDVNPLQCQTDPDGQGQQPQPGQGSAQGPPMQHPSAHRQARDQQGDAVTLNVTAILFGDRVRAVDTVELGVGRGHA